MKPSVDERVRFEALFEPEPDTGCWLWIGTQNYRVGYGKFNVQIAPRIWKTDYAHRVSWRLYRGEISADLVVDHLCRNPLCVNPDHLEPVTRQKNAIRGDMYNGETCRQGHPYSGKNLYIRPDNGKRACKQCQTQAQRLRRARKRSGA